MLPLRSWTQECISYRPTVLPSYRPTAQAFPHARRLITLAGGVRVLPASPFCD